MKLRARRSVSKYKRLSFGLAALMLVVQPMYGPILKSVNALGEESIGSEIVDIAEDYPVPTYHYPANDKVYSSGNLKLVWYAPAGVSNSRHEVRWAASSDELSSTDPQSTNSGGQAVYKEIANLANGIYYWQIRSHNTAKTSYSDWTTPRSFTVFNPATIIPEAPTEARWENPTGTVLGSYANINNITMAWNASISNSVTHYEYSYKSNAYGSGEWSDPSDKGLVTSIANQKFGTPEGAEGDWEFRVRAVSGEIPSNWAYSPVLIFDKFMPSFEITSPVNGATVSGPQKVSVRISDTNDIKKVLINVGDGHGNYVWEEGKANNKVSRDDDLYYLNIDTKTLPEGVNHVVVRATDGAGNTRYYNNRKDIHSYIVDNTAPKLLSVSLNKIFTTVDGVNYTGVALNGGKLSVTFTTNEPLRLSGSQVGLAIPGMSGPPSTGWTNAELVDASRNEYVAHIDLNNRTDTSSKNYTENFFKNKSLSDIKLRIRMVDTLGNTDSTYYAVDSNGNAIQEDIDNVNDSRLYKFTLDNVKPDLQTNLKKTLLGGNDKLVINVTKAEDSSSGLNSVQYKITPENSDVAIKGFGYTTDPIALGENTIDVSNLKQGTYRVYVRAIDKVENKLNASPVYTLFTIDRTAPDAPVISVDGLTDGQVTNKYNVIARWTKPDGGDIAKYEYKYWNNIPTSKHNAEEKAWPYSTADNHYPGAYNEGDGTHYVQVRAIDNAGNPSPWSNTFTVIYDSKKPVVSISGQSKTATDGTLYFRTARNVKVDVDDNNVGVTRVYRADGTEVLKDKSFTEKSFKIDNGLPEGEYYIIHTDKAGQPSEKVPFTVANTGTKIDNVRSSDIVNERKANSMLVLFDVLTNGGTDIDYVTYKINEFDASNTNNRGKQIFSGTVDNTEYKIDLATLMDKLQDGKKYVLMIESTNVAGVRGNEGVVYIVFAVDNTAPSDPIINPTDRDTNEPSETAAPNQLQAIQNPLSITNIDEQPAVLGAQTDNGNSSDNDNNADSTKSEETDKENSEVLADQDDKTSWSAVNAILSGVTAIMGAITLFGFFTTSSEDRRTGLRAISVIIGIGAVVALLMIEDFSLKMGFVNIWTTLFALAAIVQAIMLANIREADEE